jgi:hypothetical protein
MQQEVGRKGELMDKVTVEKVALQCLIAAGWAVFKSAQHAHAAGRDAPDMGDQIALRNAIALAEKACRHE